MARARLADVNLTERIKQASMSQAQPIIIKNSQGTTSVVYDGITGAGTLTNSFNLVTNPSMFTSGLPGFVEPGLYQVTCGGAIPQVFDTDGIDGSLAGVIAADDLKSVYNAAVPGGIYGVGATSTNGTVKFIRLVPDKQITAAKVVINTGTAVA